MNKYLLIVAISLSVSTAWAQEEDYTVVLPDLAQACVLPASPDSIPPDATYEQLVAAKGQVADFQGGVEAYRSCMQAAENDTAELSPGNKQALVQSYNYSVDMEERVAQRFNDAIRSYKERNPSD